MPQVEKLPANVREYRRAWHFPIFSRYDTDELMRAYPGPIVIHAPPFHLIAAICTMLATLATFGVAAKVGWSLGSALGVLIVTFLL